MSTPTTTTFSEGLARAPLIAKHFLFFVLLLDARVPMPLLMPTLYQDLINDHAKKITAQELREVFMARAINLEQIMRVTGKQLEAEPGSGAIAKYENTNTSLTVAESRTWGIQHSSFVADLHDICYTHI